MRSTLVLILLLIPLVEAYAQPVYFLDLEPGTYLVYNLTGVYNGIKKYEVKGKTEINGRACTLVKSYLQVKTENKLFQSGAALNSTFCYDDEGRPIYEEVLVPESLNFSISKVEIEYWWKGIKVTRAFMRIIYDINGSTIKEYEINAEKMRVFYEGREYPFSWDNLTSILPYTPSSLMEPYIDLSLDFKLGMKKTFSLGPDNATLEVMAVDEVRTPAGTFVCYRLVIKGFDRGIPYTSTVFVTKDRPRITVYYVTESEGIKQAGFLIETNMRRSGNPEYYGALVMIMVIGSIVGYKFIESLRKRKSGREVKTLPS